jgi:integrase/recombinase XerD
MVNRENAVAQPKRTYTGPLGAYIDGFVALLLREGYKPRSVKKKFDLVMDLSRWMGRRKLPLVRLDDERQLRQFRISRQRRCRLRRADTWTVDQFIRYLRDLDGIPVRSKKIDRTSLGQLTRDFESYLSVERGLSQSTILDYPLIARRFLNDRFGNKPVRVKSLRPQDLHRFIMRHLKAGSPGQAKRVVNALRSFLRFLRQRNKITIDLAAGVPGVAHWRFSHLPRSLPQNQVRKLLASCDRTTPSGQRDYAILLLMARLGLRAGEVVRMTLDDFDWTSGEIVVTGKDQRQDRLPLPRDVGAALVSYLQYARPECSTRQVFIRINLPTEASSPVVLFAELCVVLWSEQS